MVSTVSPASERSDLGARLDRLERMVARLVDLAERGTVVSRAEALAGPTPALGTVAERLSQALLEISEPEVLGALTRIATLAPQLEAAAHVAAAAPDLLEEALEVVKQHVGDDGQRRVAAIARALALVSQPDVVTAVARLGGAAPALAGPVEAAAQAVGEVRAVVGEQRVDDNVRELTRTVLDPEVMESLTRMAGLVPQLEYAAFAAAAGPELLEEALEVVREKTEEAGAGVPTSARVQAVTRAALALSRPDTLNRLIESLVRGLPLIEKLTSVPAASIDDALHVLEALSRPGNREAMDKLLENLPSLTQAVLALPTHPNTLALLASASGAMGQELEHKPERLGLFGMLRALRDPKVKSALGFGVAVARRVGGELESGVGLPAPATRALPDGKK